MEQIKRITGDSVHLISVNGDKPLKLSQISVGGGGSRPHYTGQTEFSPSTVTQTAQTEGLIVDSDITVNAMPIGSAKTPTVNVEANPTITMDGNGLVTASYAKTESITPSVTAGYVASGTAGNVTFRGSSTYQLPSQAATAITPTESAQTAVVAGKYTTGEITVNAIPSNYIGSAVPSGILSASGSTVTAASGFYPSAVSANVASGYLGATTVIAGQTASTHTYKVERQAATSGWYEAASVKNAGTVTLNNQSISATPTESAQTFTPTNSVSYITQVDVAAIPSTYVGSGVPTQSALTVSASTVTAPSGYYSAPASATVAAGSLYSVLPVEHDTIGITVDNNGEVTAQLVVLDGHTAHPVHTDGWLSSSATVDLVIQEYGSYQIPTATFWAGFSSEYTGSGGARMWKATPYTEVDTSQGDTPGFLPEGHWDGEEVILLSAVPSGTTVTPSTASQTIGGSSYMMEGPVTVNAVASASHTVGLTATYKNVGGRMFSVTPKDTVTSAGWIAASTWTGNEWMYPALQASTHTPGSTPIVIGSANTMLEGAQTIAAIPSEYVIPSGSITLSSNTTGVDVAQYAFADVAVPWTWMGEEPTVVNSSFYSDSYLLGSTSYNGWAGSTTAKAIVASAAAGTFVASAMNEYEYLINWQMDVSCVLKSTATKKATPIREVGNVWQLITRRPNSVTNITNDNFNGNTAYTYFTAPYLQYWNTSGSSTYTWSNSYGIYGTVQTPTFSNNTSDSPTVTMKTPIWYARCSSTYFATGRVGDIDQTETTLKRTCKIYRVKKGTAPREIYEGLVDIINHPL